MGKQIDAPFKFLVRPVTTVNAGSKKLSWKFEDDIFSLFEGRVFSSPISGILVLPTIMDGSIVPLSPDYVSYKRGDNSVSVGLNIDFDLWENSSELGRLKLLSENIRRSLDSIKSRYLTDDDREFLHLAVDRVEAKLGSQLH